LRKWASRGMVFVILAAVSAGIAGRYLGCGGHIIAGRRVEKVTELQYLSLVLPIPYGVRATYYVYKNEQGQQVMHGPYESFDRNGKLAYKVFYRDGKQDGTDTVWNSAGQKEQERFYRMGEDIGWANYDNGRLVYELEHVFENDKWVATKGYDFGGWTLRFNCGNKIDKDINPRTGELMDLAPPFAVSCQY